jgi:hypothetical protein
MSAMTKQSGVNLLHITVQSQDAANASGDVVHYSTPAPLQVSTCYLTADCVIIRSWKIIIGFHAQPESKFKKLL